MQQSTGRSRIFSSLRCTWRAYANRGRVAPAPLLTNATGASRSASSESAASASAAPLTPPPANSRRGFLVYKNRGFVPNDPLPDRPPEDDVAQTPMYFELLANLHHYTKESGPILDRLARLRDPRNWVALLVTLTNRRQVVPAVITAVEARFIAEPEAWRDLNGHHLSALAYAVYAQRGGSKAFWEALAGRAGAIAPYSAADHANLSAALSGCGHAVALPAGLEIVSEEK